MNTDEHRCCLEQVERVRGAECSIAGENLDAFVARDDSQIEGLLTNYGLDFDADEIKAFFGAKPHEKENFSGVHPGCTAERSAIYNAVYRCMYLLRSICVINPSIYPPFRFVI